MLLATVIWGAGFVVVKGALIDLPVFHLLFFRFTLGGLLLLPLALRSGARRPTAAALWVGLAMFAECVLQTYGLVWTTPARSAFLSGLSVLMVPAIGWVTGVERPRPGPLAGALCAAAGLYALYRPDGQGQPFGLGDWLTLGGALAFAIQVLLIERAVKTTGVTALTVTQFFVVALLCAPSLALHPPTPVEWAPRSLLAILLIGVLATALAFLCQAYAQSHLSAVETAVLLTLEPVFAAATSVLVGVEALGAPMLEGGALVVLAMVLAQLGPADRSTPSPA